MVLAVREWLPWTAEEESARCRCTYDLDGDRLSVDATDCPNDGDLADAPACRAGSIAAIGDSRIERVLVTADGREAAYLNDASDLLAAAGRFATRVEAHDERLAANARRKPVAAGATAGSRADPIRSIAEDTGFLAAAGNTETIEAVLRPAVAPSISDARIVRSPPESARLLDQRELDTGAVVRTYDRSGELPLYHVEPLEARLGADALAALDRAGDLVATGAVSGEGAARTAVRRVVDDPSLLEPLGAVLEKHTADLGILVDCFADPAVTDVFASPPIPETPLRVRVDGVHAETNVRLSERGARALASTFRRRSGRAFSRANPMLDATASAGDRDIRVAGTTDPVSNGLSFAIRAHERQPWTLPRLVANGTIPAGAAALLSVAVKRDAAVLVAGPRGAGKTTLLGALLFELPADVRTLLIEDTPELPVQALRDDGRDVQTLHTETGDGPGLPPAAVLRGALRLGEGALAVGEVRGEEVNVLYEAMRVGASDSAVLGTIHGEGGDSIRERVVSDLGVPASSFAITDLVVTLESRVVAGERVRRLATIEEVIDGADGVHFASLWEPGQEGAVPTDRLDRGRSRFVERIATPGESYADVRDALQRRGTQFDRNASPAPTDGSSTVVTNGC